MSNDELFGKKIAELRKERKLQQEEFAEIIGVTRQSVSLWENNIRIPRADKIYEICSIMDIDPGYFFKDAIPIEIAATHNYSVDGSESINLKVKKMRNMGIFLVIGWIIYSVQLTIAVTIAIIVGMSINASGTAVVVYSSDTIPLIIILSILSISFLSFLIVFTIKYYKRRYKNDK